MRRCTELTYVSTRLRPVRPKAYAHATGDATRSLVLTRIPASPQISVSPKGLFSSAFVFRGGNAAAYVDLGGSGVETIAHVKENGRVTVLFSSFDAGPRIVRLFCRGRVVERCGGAMFDAWMRRFGEDAREKFPAARAVIVLDIFKVSSPPASVLWRRTVDGPPAATGADLLRLRCAPARAGARSRRRRRAEAVSRRPPDHPDGGRAHGREREAGRAPGYVQRALARRAPGSGVRCAPWPPGGSAPCCRRCEAARAGRVLAPGRSRPRHRGGLCRPGRGCLGFGCREATRGDGCGDARGQSVWMSVYTRDATRCAPVHNTPPEPVCTSAGDSVCVNGGKQIPAA